VTLATIGTYCKISENRHKLNTVQGQKVVYFLSLAKLIILAPAFMALLFCLSHNEMNIFWFDKNITFAKHQNIYN